ncbi:MAG: class I SAM-dependent methyltransferase [Acidobacteriota bacterium]|jgi:SAM-dependent methyltransferase
MAAERGSSGRASGLMEPHLIDDLAHKERFYWWHRVRRGNLYRLTGLRAASGGRVLEIGCGTGANLREQISQLEVAVGFDLEMRALSYCRDLFPVQGDAHSPLPFVDDAFDAVLMIDILEHLADPGALIEEVGRILTLEGAAVVMVPAGPGLWSYWDEMHGHYRRYTRTALASIFGDGWRMQALEYSFSWMYPVVWAFRRFMQRWRRSPTYSDFIEVPNLVNGVLVAIGRLEGQVQGFIPAPFGTTLCGVWLKDGEP